MMMLDTDLLRFQVINKAREELARTYGDPTLLARNEDGYFILKKFLDSAAKELSTPQYRIEVNYTYKDCQCRQTVQITVVIDV